MWMISSPLEPWQALAAALPGRRERPAKGVPLRRRHARVVPGLLLVCAAACVRTFSTDIPVNYQMVVEKKYVGRTAWTRQTLQDEKKPGVKVEQDEEVSIVTLGMQRTGSVTVVTRKGHKRVVFPFRLPRPLTLEVYEKTLLDYLWLESPEARFEKNKTTYGTRIAEAVRDHKILKDMPQYVAYLTWGAPTSTLQVEGSRRERWAYESPNLAGARIDFDAGRVVAFDGENVADTEAAKRKKSVRRGTQTAETK